MLSQVEIYIWISTPLDISQASNFILVWYIQHQDTQRPYNSP